VPKCRTAAVSFTLADDAGALVKVTLNAGSTMTEDTGLPAPRRFPRSPRTSRRRSGDAAVVTATPMSTDRSPLSGSGARSAGAVLLSLDERCRLPMRASRHAHTRHTERVSAALAGAGARGRLVVAPGRHQSDRSHPVDQPWTRAGRQAMVDSKAAGGGLSEWPMEAVLKTARQVPNPVSWVRIPRPPLDFCWPGVERKRRPASPASRHQ
jgi:hypothetical protein